MASSDFTLEMNQEILKWIFGGAVTQPVPPIAARWMAIDDATSISPGTEVSAGAPSRVALTWTNATANNGEVQSATSSMNSEGFLAWNFPSTQISGNELWDSSTPPRRICYDNSNFGFYVTNGDYFEWTGTSSGIAIVAFALDDVILQHALNWTLGKTTGWTRPVGPFKIKLYQDEDYVNTPKATLNAAPMQTVTFGAVGVDSDNQAAIRSNVNVTFPSFSATQAVVVSRYEIWDSSTTPRLIASRRPGQDYDRDGYSQQFAYVPAGQTLTIPLGSLKISLGRGDS